MFSELKPDNVLKDGVGSCFLACHSIWVSCEGALGRTIQNVNHLWKLVFHWTLRVRLVGGITDFTLWILTIVVTPVNLYGTKKSSLIFPGETMTVIYALLHPQKWLTGEKFRNAEIAAWFQLFDDSIERVVVYKYNLVQLGNTSKTDFRIWIAVRSSNI